MNTITKTYFINADPDGTVRYFKTEEGRSPSTGVIAAIASITLTSDAPSLLPLTANAIAGFGDEITFKDDAGVTQVRTILTKPLATTVTISGAAVTVTGKPFTFRPVRGGTTATDGWHDVSSALSRTIQTHVTTKTSTTVVVSVEGKMGGPGAVPSVLVGYSHAATGGIFTPIPEDIMSIRVGVSTTGDAAGDVVSAWVTYTVDV